MSTSILAAPEGSRRYATVRYEGSTKGYFWFFTKGMLLTLLTVGVYRFWFTTAVRKNLWARAFIDGSAVEYVGNAHELLLGFLVAIVVLIPTYIVVFIATVYLPDPILSYLFSYILLFLLIQFARYRARRYIASRTLWRGIRFRQDGSAVTYAALTTGWWLVNLVTLGVAYPFMRASLERYRVRHTLFGDARFTSDARGRSLLISWLIVYALGVLPLFICAFVLLAVSRFEIPMVALHGDSITESAILVYMYCVKTLPNITVKSILCIGASSIVLWIALSPYYRSREARAFYSAVGIGGARMRSTLSATDIYINMFYFCLCVAMIFVSIAVPFFAAALILPELELYIEISQFVYGYVVFSYAACIFSIAWFYFRFLQVGRLAIIAKTLSITGVDAFAAVTTSARKVGSRFAEGVADAVDPGGIEVGF